MRLIIVRHGQTEGNAKQVVEGDDAPLNRTGIEQARKVAERLKAEKIDFIYSSRIERAKMTAQEIARNHPEAEFCLEDGLKEVSQGDFLGKTWADIKRIRKESGLPKHEFIPPNGESYEEVCKRIRAVLDRVIKEHSDKTVLFVTHGGVKRIILGMLRDMDISDIVRERCAGNTAVSIIDFSEDGHEIKVSNCDKHLD